MHPPWRREDAIDDEGSDDDDGPDNEDQEGGGPVTDIERREVQTAFTAP
jgi:hypothetical protein